MTASRDAGGVSGKKRQTSLPDLPEIIEWLAGDECHELDDAGLAAELGRRLRASGLPLNHLGLYLRTLHPEIVGRTIGWAPGETPKGCRARGRSILAMEEGEHSISHELDHFASCIADGLHDAVEVLIEQLEHAFARKAVRQLGEAPQIAKLQGAAFEPSLQDVQDPERRIGLDSAPFLMGS